MAGELAKELGAKRVMPIPVSGAFHTPLMQGARGPLRKALAEVTFRTPEVRVVANVDARVHDDPADWPGLLSAQLCSPVRWRQTLETFAGLGLTSLIELGPGGVLSGLAKRSLPEIQSLAVAKPADLDTLMDQDRRGGHLEGRARAPPGRAPLHVRAGGREPGQRRLHTRGVAAGAGDGPPPRHRGHRRRARRRRRLGASPWATSWAGSASPRSAPPSPARSSAGWPPPASGSRTASPWSGCASRTGPDLMAVVLVTGGNRGIGAACVRWFLANGDQVATTYRSGDPPPPPRGRRRRPLPRRAAATSPTPSRSSRPSPPSRAPGARWRSWWPTPASPGTASCCA